MITPDWEVLEANDFVLPENADLQSWVDAAFLFLASPDPFERGELGCAALGTWIETGELDGTLQFTGGRAAQLLDASEIQTRTFAALILAETILRDADVRLVPASGLRTWQADWAAWYVQEGDLRGWVDGPGWLHALAHGADVAGALARHPALGRVELVKLLGTLKARMQTVQTLPDQSEEDRIALAAFLVLSRPEVTLEDQGAWLADLQTIWRPEYARPRSVAAAFSVQVARSLLMFAHLGALLPGGAVFPAPEPARLLTPLLIVLKMAFPAYPA